MDVLSISEDTQQKQLTHMHAYDITRFTTFEHSHSLDQSNCRSETWTTCYLIGLVCLQGHQYITIRSQPRGGVAGRAAPAPAAPAASGSIYMKYELKSVKRKISFKSIINPITTFSEFSKH